MKDVILTAHGPKPIGPYSQAIKSNGFVFISGQIALDPKTTEMVGTDVRQQTERVIENLKGILEASGTSFHRCASGANHHSGRRPAERRSRRDRLDCRVIGRVVLCELFLSPEFFRKIKTAA